MKSSASNTEIVNPNFDAEAEYVPVGSASICSITTPPLSGERNKEQIAENNKQCFGLTFITSGRMHLNQHGRQTVIKSGEIVLTDSDAVSSFSFEELTHSLSLSLPGPLVHSYLPQAEIFCNRVLSAGQGYTNSLKELFFSISNNSSRNLTGPIGHATIKAALDLMVASFAIIHPLQPARKSKVQTHLDGIFAYIEEHLADIELTPESIADAFGFSTRYLRKIFATEKVCISKYIQHRRLDKCAEQLANEAWNGHSISKICFFWGFNSSSHFSRTFKLYYGITPTEYRNRLH
tara:strand:- start:49738 stop:50613 length:876 start_codon:yes stop_codon:yes gene_type:complete